MVRDQCNVNVNEFAHSLQLVEKSPVHSLTPNGENAQAAYSVISITSSSAPTLYLLIEIEIHFHLGDCYADSFPRLPSPASS